METIQKLMKMIRLHNHECFYHDGKIIALCAYTIDGKLHHQWELIDPDQDSVKNWLGY